MSQYTRKSVPIIREEDLSEEEEEEEIPRRDVFPIPRNLSLRSLPSDESDIEEKSTTFRMRSPASREERRERR